jgi:hypothetical protein
MSVGFSRIASLNGDPCDWNATQGDSGVGPSPADLMAALSRQTAYDASEPVDVTLGGYSGKQIDLLIRVDTFANPSAGDQASLEGHAVGCDEEEYRIWNAAGFDVYAQGPENAWRVWSLDVDGTRVDVVAYAYPGTSTADRAESEAVVQSIGIGP